MKYRGGKNRYKVNRISWFLRKLQTAELESVKEKYVKK